MKKLIIGEKEIGEKTQTFIISEIASAHEGSLKLMKKLIKAGVNSKADAVKFQIFKTDKLLAKNHPKYKSFKELEFDEGEWFEIFEYAKKNNATILADVFDKESADLANEFVAGFKIHSTNVSDLPLLIHVAKKRKPILIGVGGCTEEEIRKAVSIIRKFGNGIALIAGFQSFPTKDEDINLNLITTLKRKFNLPIGFADHISAESALSLIVPLLAISLGACIIEKHITLNRSLRGRDYYSAITSREFKKMVEMIRKTEKIFGSGKFLTSNAEIGYRNLMKKFIVAKQKIRKGNRITEKMIEFKRTPEKGLLPTEAEKVIGKKAKKNIKEDETLTLEKVE